MRIKSIKVIEKPDVVYNLSVEDNENYVANGVVVHNCHGARGVKISDYLKFCMRAEFKIGTTGTLPTSKCISGPASQFLERRSTRSLQRS